MRMISNFFMQLMLVFLVFNVSSISLKGQIKARTSSSSVVLGSGGSGIECWDLSSDFPIDILIKRPNSEEFIDLALADFVFGCDVVVGVTNENNETLYTPLNTFSSFSPKGSVTSNINRRTTHASNCFEDNNQVGVGSYQGTLQLVQLPEVSQDDCREGKVFEFYTFNLYCHNEGVYTEIDACNTAVEIDTTLLDKCSYSIEVGIFVCCNEEEPYVTPFGEDVFVILPEVKFNNSELTITSSRNDTYISNYKIINLSGQSFLGGELVLSPNGSVEIDVDVLPPGVYFSIFSDGKGELVTKKIIKF